MVCVANEVKVKCVVQDGTNKSVSSIFTLPASTTTEELYKTVFAFHKCEPDSFELLFQPYQAKNTIELIRSRDITLLQLDPNCLNQTTTILMKATDQPPQHNIPLAPPIFTTDNATLFTDDSSPPPLATDSEDQITRKMTFRFSEGYKRRSSRADKYCSNDPSLNQTVDFISNQLEKNYVGLVNQAMTCYLNSLLQALYMTPEFRNALYNWEYVDGSENEEAMSIPYQLQKLFLNLQTSTKSAVETTSLTKSFGWDSTEAWQQHDIQELCRVMFDALETKFKDTEQADLINRLYEGKMIDYVKCLECKTEKSREDTFLDIPLPVRPFGSSIAYGSVEEALRAFVKYETLDGNNQYHCEKCNKKCDAHKGLKFTKFPYLLSLHLKRFDFDCSTLYRIKLNDKVTFPHELDLNSFIKTAPNQESHNGEEDDEMIVKCDDSSTTDSGTLEDECLPCDGAICTNYHSSSKDQQDDEGIDMSNGISTSNVIAHNHENEKNQGKCSKDQGPYIYELFSIMIHSGSASGGHYYAYIKDFTTSQWLCFNDTSVNPITHNDIQKVYGGGPLRVYSSSTNAYMLMYRQIDKTKNSVPIQEENFPQHIQALLKKMKESEDDDRRYHSRHSPTYKIKIYCHHPKTKKLMINKLNTIGESTWAEQTEKAYEKFGLHDDVNLDQCRLVFYDPLNDLITHCYDGSDEDSMYDVFKGDKRNDLLLEIREKDQPFEAYKPEGIATKVYVIDVPQADIIDGPINVRGYQAQTVREYKQQLSKIVNIDPDEMNLVVVVFSQYQLLRDDKTLEAEGLDVHSEHKVYVSLAFDTDITESSKNTTTVVPSSQLLSVIESLEKVIWIHVQLPEVNKEIIEYSNIPSLENEIKEENSNHPTNGQMKVNGKDELDLDELSEKKSVKVSENGSKFATLALDDKIKSSQNVETSAVKWQAGLESASEDSSLSDSEKTLVDDNCGSYNNHQRYYDDNKFKKFYQSFVNSDSDEESDHYFKGTPCPSEDNEKLLRVLVDKRMRFETLKKKLEGFVGVPVDYFNVYHQPADSPETECTDFKTSLKLNNDGARFCVKLGRALRKGELKLKLYQLHLECAEQPFKFMFDWIVAKNMTVAQAKEEILKELKRKYELEIPFQRCRLRKKSNRLASVVLLNTSRFEDLNISSQDEVIVQELPEDETVTEPKQLVLFVRKWSRSTLQLCAIQEVVLTGRAISELKEKINLLSNIPEESIDIAKGKGSFPCESMSLLNVENDLDWKVKVTEVDKWPLDLEDGSVVLYRDSREILKQLNPEEKREFTNKENSRLLSLGLTPSYSSPRREKALKIYLDSK